MEISKEKAKRLFGVSPEWFKNELKNSFGEELFKEKGFEQIKTFDDACLKLSIDPGTLFNETDTSDERAYKKLKVIVKAINEGWQPNSKDGNQKKWFPVFVLSSGFGFSHSYYDYAGTDVGSRLCFESEEKSTYAATQFIEIYQEFLTITQ
jgi:hypothetical protein